MNCPLKVINATVPTELIKDSSIIECDGGKCAWWFAEKGGCCSITAIAQLLELARHGNFGR